MSRLIPNAERIIRARALIQKAYELPIPVEGGRHDFSYIAQVKAFLQDARDSIKFIPRMPSTSDEMKEDIRKIFLEAEAADKKILHSN